jgi:hypothetical protein
VLAGIDDPSVAVGAGHDQCRLFGRDGPGEQLEYLSVKVVLARDPVQRGADLKQRPEIPLHSRRRRRLGRLPEIDRVFDAQACRRFDWPVEHRRNARRRVQHEQKHRATEGYLVAVGQQMIDDLHAVDECAVRALEVANAPCAIGRADRAMRTRQRQVGEADIVRDVAPDSRPALGQRQDVAGQRS